MRKILAALVLTLCLSGTSFAQSKNARQFLGTFGAWSAYKMKENGADLCYMVSEPTKSEGKYKRRGDIFLIIANRPADKTFNVMSLTAGYTYKKGSSASIQVDKNTPMDLFTNDDTAWTNTAKTDAAITKQMRAGNVAVIKGRSSLGTLTTDTFSLKGFTKANDAIAKACPRKK